MHSFIIVGDDIATLDTKAEREEAAKLMQHYGLTQASVFRGGPDGNEAPEGRDFCSDGTFRYDGMNEYETPAAPCCRYCGNGNDLCICD